MDEILRYIFPVRLNQKDFLTRVIIYFLVFIPYYFLLTIIPCGWLGVAALVTLGVYCFVAIILPRANDCRWRYAIISLQILDVVDYYYVFHSLLLVLIADACLLFIGSRTED